MFRYFTIKFHFSFFVSFRFKFFASLRFSNFHFEAKQSKIQVYYFAFFIALKFSLCFNLVIFASKRNAGENFFASKEAKFNIFRIISLPNFVPGEKKTIFVSLQFFSLNFRLFYLCFLYRFLVFRMEVKYVKQGFFFASKRNKIFASISNLASEANVRVHSTWDSYTLLTTTTPLLNTLLML